MKRKNLINKLPQPKSDSSPYAITRPAFNLLLYLLLFTRDNQQTHQTGKGMTGRRWWRRRSRLGRVRGGRGLTVLVLFIWGGYNGWEGSSDLWVGVPSESFLLVYASVCFVLESCSVLSCRWGWEDTVLVRDTNYQKRKSGTVVSYTHQLLYLLPPSQIHLVDYDEETTILNKLVYQYSEGEIW